MERISALVNRSRGSLQRWLLHRIAALVLIALTAAVSLHWGKHGNCAELSSAPNIVFILADDLGGKDLGCYGSEVFQTPNLDRMAAGGMRFTSAYAASCVCSPTRASIMTGKYPARLGLTIWLGGKGGAPAVDHLPLEETTIAEALRGAGYATALIGKWHLGGEPYWPKQQGFDIAIGEPHAGSPAGGYYLPNQINLPGAKPGDYLTDRLTDEAVKIIESHRDRPFFLYQAYHSVHTPIQGRPDLVKKHQDRAAREGKSFNPSYAAMIESLDAGVGRILDTLGKHNLLQRTVVFFTSDNGGYAYSAGKKNDVTDNSPLRFGKGYCYEGGHRVPLLVHYPPLVRPGSICEEPVVTTDFYPTILRLAELAPMPQQHRDGRDISPLLRDSNAQLDRDAIYWHYPHNSPQGGSPSGAIRVGDWKLIEFFDDGRRELYDLSADLGEQHDLARANPEKLKELHDRLAAWRREVIAKMPSDAPPQTASPGSPAGDLELAITKDFPGFAQLVDVQLNRCELGFEAGSTGNGLALRKLEEPITGRAIFRLRVQPSAEFPSNGFLAFGAEPTDAATIKCGLLVGGRRLSVFCGSYPPAKPSDVLVPLSGGKIYNLEVAVDLRGSAVTVKAAGKEVTVPLPPELKAIHYVGYAPIRTVTQFSEILVERP